MGPIIIFEGLHPMHDKRVLDLLDFTLYLDISDDVKLNWKIQRDMEERGHSLESIMASIEARKPDFDAYIAPQKENACSYPGIKLASGPDVYFGKEVQVL